MKKIINELHLYGLLIGILCLAGCSEEVKPTPLTYSQLLTGTTSKTWRFSGFQIVEAGQVTGSFDASQWTDECEIDDLYVFYADKDRKYEIQEGPSKCRPDNPEILFTDTWSVVNATSTINFVFRSFPTGSFMLRSITDRTMTVEYYVKEYNFGYRFIFASQRN